MANQVQGQWSNEMFSKGEGLWVMVPPSVLCNPLQLSHQIKCIFMEGIAMTDEDRIKQLQSEIEFNMKEIDRKKKNNRIELYNTGAKIHKKQVTFHESSKRIKAFFGGNRVGKTVSGAVEAVCHATGNSRFRKLEPSSGWVVSLTNEVQRDVAQKEILRWLPKSEIKDFIIRHGRKDDPENSIIDKIILNNGCTIGFKTCEQGRESFQGTSQGWIWFDEEPDEDIYKECRMRVLDTKGDIWFTMTPLKGLTWVYKLIYLNLKKDPNISYCFAQWEDNPWLPKEEIEELILAMPEKEREARQYGKFSSLCGLAFPEMDENIHFKPKIDDIPDYFKRVVTIDYGMDMLAAIWLYIDNQGKARGYKELAVEGLIISEAAKLILQHNGDDEIYEYLAPPDLFSRNNETGKRRSDVFYDNGISLTKTSNDRVTGWDNLREWLHPYDIKDEETGDIVRTARLTFDRDAMPETYKCLSGIQKDDKNPNDVESKKDHEITHLPDSIRCFAIRWTSPSVEKKSIKNKDLLINKIQKKVENRPW